jgi:hypothetical protein
MARLLRFFCKDVNIHDFVQLVAEMVRDRGARV